MQVLYEVMLQSITCFLNILACSLRLHMLTNGTVTLLVPWYDTSSVGNRSVKMRKLVVDNLQRWQQCVATRCHVGKVVKTGNSEKGPQRAVRCLKCNIALSKSP
ncbi:hypothetical protein TNCT_57061 [Trichonephila clavata]|uniref:Uncharacterized protein n=1 Tax=Trichonephila clavata TaxID=2740835 RepID=A0A8X6IIV5_TRICU|nr:hypothetical protein TNCT_57061 [Trichonephila clavata]